MDENLLNIIKSTVKEELDKKNETIKMMVESCVNKSLHVPNMKHKKNNKTRNEPNNTEINILNFGTENYEYLLMPVLTDIIKKMNDFNAILQKIIIELFFNEFHKENHNIFIPNNSYKTITIFDENIWKNVDLEITLEKVIKRGNDVLQHYLVGSESDEQMFKQEIGKKKLDQLKEFTDKIDNIELFADFRRQLFKETEHTITTYQHMIHLIV